MLTVLLGGVRSGKTTLATDIAARRGGTVTYLATAAPIDDDMASRIGNHRDERPEHWVTVEEQLDLTAAIGTVDTDVLIVDCLTTWVANHLHHGSSDDRIRRAAALGARSARDSAAHVVVVTNEVGMGVHPTSDLGRHYRDILGWVNQQFVEHSDHALLLVAGRALPLTDPWTHLP